MLIVGIAGGTGAGKSTVVRKIMDKLPKDKVALIPQDNYYKDNSHLELTARQQLNFDHPSAIEFELIVEHLNALKQGNMVQMPMYSYLTCTRSHETVLLNPKDVVVVEGILIMTNPALRDLLDIKVFVDAEPDERLMRCIQRDILERGRSVREVLERYERTVKPMHNQFIEPSKRYADIIVPQGGSNHVAIQVLASMIKSNLKH
jgi:uridine kinase